MSVLLRAVGLRGGYGRREVVAGVGLDIVPGRCVAVLGPNGTGKSTLVRLLGGILPASGGRVELLGRPLAAWRRRHVARHVALVPQLVEFAFPLTVREVVEQGRAPHLGPWRPPSAEDDEAVHLALRRVGLEKLEGTSVQRLSGGERQLVLLARALATRPRVLLLDEPAAALDVRHQLELVAIVRSLLAEGVGALVVLHDWNLALRVADDLVVLRDGRVHARGTPAEVVSPDLFREVFQVEVEVLPGRAGVPFVVPGGRSPLG